MSDKCKTIFAKMQRKRAKIGTHFCEDWKTRKYILIFNNLQTSNK